MIDALNLRPSGHVKQILCATGEVVRDQDNLVVDASIELMLQALFGATSIQNVIFANTGQPVTPGLRSLPGLVVGAVNATHETRNFASRDNHGMATIGTFTSILKPATGLTYDTLGLASTTLVLFAATSFQPVVLAPNQAIAIEWTILLRG